jgi:hypothetical protein
VSVYRLIAKGTIEEVKYMIQLYKTELKTTTLSGDDQKGQIGKGDGYENNPSCAPREDYGAGEGKLKGRRNFEAIQGDSSCRGELFGAENLMKYSSESLLNELRLKYGLVGATRAGDVEEGAPDAEPAESGADVSSAIGIGMDPGMRRRRSKLKREMAFAPVDVSVLQGCMQKAVEDLQTHTRGQMQGPAVDPDALFGALIDRTSGTPPTDMTGNTVSNEGARNAGAYTQNGSGSGSGSGSGGGQTGPFTHNDSKHPDTTSANNLVSSDRRGRLATTVGAGRGIKASMGGGTVSRPSNHSASTLVTVADKNQVSTHAASASASNAGGAADRPISHTTSNGAASRPKPAPKRPAPAPAPPPAKPVKKLHRPNYS